MKKTSFNKIFVLGAGAIGSVIGALLSKHNDVTLIGNKAHSKTVNQRGLLISGDINETFKLSADTEIREIPEKTLIILTTKAYDTEKAVGTVKKLLEKDTTILIIQNGLGNEKVVKRVVGTEVRVFRGLTTMASEFLEPGKIRYWNGETVFGRNDETEEIADVFSRCNLETRLSSDMEKEVWMKLVINCVINPLTALFQIRNWEISVDSLKKVRHGIVSECVEVGEAEGISFPSGLEERIDHKISGYTGAHYSSMCQDLMKNKRTEIDFLNGRVAELGRKHKLHTPINDALYDFIRFLENKNGISKKN